MRILRLLVVLVVLAAVSCSFDTDSSNDDEAVQDAADDAGRDGGADDNGSDDGSDDDRRSSRDEDDDGAMGEDEVDYDESIDLAISDIEDFWIVQMPDVYGLDYNPIDPDDIIPGTSDTDFPDCGGYPVTYEDVNENAFHCSIPDFVTYDDEELFPRLFGDYGTAGLAVVLAHEFGHRAQTEVGFGLDETIPTLTFELQADCFAGAWVAYVHAGDSDTLELLPGSLEAGLGSLLEFKDPVGSLADDPMAHGSGFDRVSAFQQGFESGVTLCATYVDVPPANTLFDFLDAEDFENEGNLDLPDAIDLAEASLNIYWSQFDGFVPIDDLEPFDVDDRSLPECGRSLDEPDELEDQVFYCPDDHFVAFDEDALEDAHDVGDFKAITLLGLAWANAALDGQGYDLDADEAPLFADCLTGSYAGALLREEVADVDPATGELFPFLLSPGDLDEAVSALLEPVASGNDDVEPDAAFIRIQAFRIGFDQGAGICEQAADDLD